MVWYTLRTRCGTPPPQWKPLRTSDTACGRSPSGKPGILPDLAECRAFHSGFCRMPCFPTWASGREASPVCWARRGPACTRRRQRPSAVRTENAAPIRLFAHQCFFSPYLQCVHSTAICYLRGVPCVRAQTLRATAPEQTMAYNKVQTCCGTTHAHVHTHENARTRRTRSIPSRDCASGLGPAGPHHMPKTEHSATVSMSDGLRLTVTGSVKPTCTAAAAAVPLRAAPPPSRCARRRRDA